MTNHKGTPEDAFWASVVKGSSIDDCWKWSGTINGSGYAYTRTGHGKTGAHRFAYELLVGPIPEGFEVDHLCHNQDPHCRGRGPCPHRSCTNPRHLAAVTVAENRQLDLPTHCLRGHEFTEENTRVRYGSRWCRKCDALRAQTYRQRRKAQEGTV